MQNVVVHATGCIGVRLRRGLGGEWWRNEDASCKSFLNGKQKVTHNSRLQDVPHSTGSQASLDKIGVGMNRQENDPRCTARFAQLLAGLYATENRHGNIRDDDIWLKMSRGVEQGLAIRHAPNNFACWFQQTFHHV
jgi:hypothetical protein